MAGKEIINWTLSWSANIFQSPVRVATRVQRVRSKKEINFAHTVCVFPFALAISDGVFVFRPEPIFGRSERARLNNGE